MLDHPAQVFCAFFDMIGFKRRRLELGTAGIYQVYERGILPHIQHSAALGNETVVQGGREMLIPKQGPFSLGYRVVSDSLMLYSKDDGLNSFMAVVDASHRILQGGFSPKLPWRGAIGHGDLIAAESILIGSALEDAYEWESKQVWAGVVLTPAAEAIARERDYLAARKTAYQAGYARKPNRLDLGQDADLLLQYSVPLQTNPKSGPVVYTEQLLYCIDWTVRMYPEAVEKAFDASDNAHAQNIKSNTAKFEGWARARPERLGSPDPS